MKKIPTKEARELYQQGYDNGFQAGQFHMIDKIKVWLGELKVKKK